MSSQDDADDVYAEEYSIVEGDDSEGEYVEGDDGEEEHIVSDGDAGADEEVVANGVKGVDEDAVADGDEGVLVGIADDGDAGGEAIGDAICAIRDGASDDVDDVVRAAVAATRSNEMGS